MWTPQSHEKTSFVHIVLLSLFFLFVSTHSWAKTTGSIRGELTNSDGNPLQGASITIRSNVLITGSQNTSSNELGVFRFPSVPVGIYSIDITLNGFESVRIDKVDVRLNATATVPVSMKILNLSETLNVIGENSILDLTHAGISTSYKNEFLDEVPTRRQFFDSILFSPGISVNQEDWIAPLIAAFGSNVQSNSWNIDGVNFTAPETGFIWGTVIGSDDVQEIQVMGVGATAEYGNHMGAVFNVVTKRGANDFHGGTNYYFQTDALTGKNVVLPDSPFTFHRDYFRNLSAQLGGPLRKDRVWFFTSGEYWHDAYTEPGIDPDFAPPTKRDKYQVKVSAALGDKHQFTGFTFGQIFDSRFVSPYVTPDATGGERGTNPGWGAGLTSTLNQELLLEINYGGWWTNDINNSTTGGLDDPLINFTPEGGGPPTQSNGVWFPWDYVTWRNQFQAKLTYYADDFLKRQHEFKFGGQFSKGYARLNYGIGANGVYFYDYGSGSYQVVQDPFQYGGTSNDVGLFIDDSVTINDSFTLNVGFRYDRSRGSIPDFDRLAVGSPSISPAGNFIKTGEIIPGVKNVTHWDLISPRFGFALQPRNDGRSIINGSFGVYYDQNVIGNWEFPPPGVPIITVFKKDPISGDFKIKNEFPPPSVGHDPDIKAPRTLQFSLGYDQELSNSFVIGTQYVYKTTRDLVGWEILGGEYEPYTFIDPFTGTEHIALSQVTPPLLRKGNDPGNFPGSESLRYFQKYHGLVITANKRFSNHWGLNGSYTWSRSTGLLPRMLDSTQFIPFFSQQEGSDPNNFINAEGRLQADRPHMFRLQAVLQDLPWSLQVSTSLDISNGRPHTRQMYVDIPGQGRSIVIMEPRGSYELSTVTSVDLSISKQIPIGNDTKLRFEGWILNLLNSDYETALPFRGEILQSPTEAFSPVAWVKPRRLQIRIGFQF